LLKNTQVNSPQSKPSIMENQFEVAKAADLTLTHRCYRYYAGWVDKIRGHTIAMDGPFN
jgi:hypothetical protein